MDKNGKPYRKGAIIKNEKYAMTLQKIRDDPYSFYNGSLAKMISRDIRIRIPPYKARKGKVTEQDLKNYTTVIREPLESEVAGMKMLLTPPPTSGAVLGLVLNILKGRWVFCSPPPHHHDHILRVNCQRTFSLDIIIIIIIIIIIMREVRVAQW